MTCTDTAHAGDRAGRGRGYDVIPVGSYGRLSEDKALKSRTTSRKEGEQVADQLKRNEQFATKSGWTIVREYNDNNTPASDPLIVRPEFEQMLKDLASGAIRGIVFTHADRLARLEFDAARINRLYLINPKLVGRAVDGGTDLSTIEGRSMFMVQATMGGVEVANTKRRVSGTNKANAERGRMHGAPRPFGWASDRKTLHDKEAAVLRAGILAVPGGKTVGQIRKEWIALGYKPKVTKRRRNDGSNEYSLQHSTVEARLVNPRVCGFQTYLPQAERRGSKKPWMPDHVVYKSGKPVPGDWEIIFSPEEWAACAEEIERRKNARKGGGDKPHDTSQKYLLSGIARCGLCSFPMNSNWYPRGTSSYVKYGYRYACLTNLGGCGGITRVGPPIEDLVTAVYLDEVRRSLGVGNAPEKIDETQNDERLAEIAQEMNEVNERRRAKRISMTQTLDLIEELEEERDKLTRERRKLLASRVQRQDASQDLLRDWSDYSIPEKKHWLRQSIRAVLIHPAGRGKRFDPELIEIVWAG
ncbi:recombinase family protein [Streptomyces sp. NBC_01481]|uniref:recombinase family protein n=1 Tax=Streptomyces sp. NBC_01481 TaxID=2975869 RepID=UPI0022577EB2|nr:recombinase family protein [Streptomyces sp. NBC_01481]MCX4586711.1 recombinase family protein [Streptomyces sp. NBC_01481]